MSILLLTFKAESDWLRYVEYINTMQNNFAVANGLESGLFISYTIQL